jgi:methylmalonyl-CoA mutase, N-terminal domain
MAQVEALGGAVAAVEAGWVQDQIAEAAYAAQRRVERGEQVVVGVNRFAEGQAAPVPVFAPDEAVAREQAEALAALRSGRDNDAVRAALVELRAAASGDANVLPPMREALRRLATVGEVCGALREVWGEYRP